MIRIRDKNRQKDEISLNLTPLIDVIFLLLLFFMVSTTFKQATQLNLDLPDASRHENISGSESTRISIEIGIDAKGRYFLQQKALNTNNALVLKKVLSLMLKNNKTPDIIIVGDKLAPHQAVVSAMDVVGQLGITQLKIRANTQHKQN